DTLVRSHLRANDSTFASYESLAERCRAEARIARFERFWTQKIFDCQRSTDAVRIPGTVARRRALGGLGRIRLRGPIGTRPSGADRDRTDDLRLAKPALPQLSYSPDVKCSASPTLLPKSGPEGPSPEGVTSGWARAELNCRPHAYQACALTT